MSENPDTKKARPNFKELARQETETLSRQREELKAKKAEIDTRLDEIDREIEDLNRYLNPSPAQTRAEKKSTPRKTPTGRVADRQGPVLEAITKNPNKKAGELIELLGAKDNPASVYQAIANLKKANKIRSDGKGRSTVYFAMEAA